VPAAFGRADPRQSEAALEEQPGDLLDELRIWLHLAVAATADALAG
jgi:hypothetical protein